MKYAFILIPLLCYAAQGLQSYLSGDRPHALVWWSYSAGNIGFLWYEYSR